MNPFTYHTQQQGVSYIAHWVFATSIALRLLSSVIAFACHGVFPFINIRRSLDLEATSRYLQQRNGWIESKKAGKGMENRNSWQQTAYSEVE